MVLILAGNSEHIVNVHAWRKIGLFGEKKNPICDCTSSNQLPSTDQRTEIAAYMRPISELPFII